MNRPALLLPAFLLSCGGIAVSTPAGDERDEQMQTESGDSAEDPDFDGNDVPPPDCTGNFGDWKVLFEDPGWISQALAPSSNGLEFFYARFALDTTLDDSGTRLLTLRSRVDVDADFGNPVILWDLVDGCETTRPGTELAGLDLSVDGRRLYVACSPFEFEANSTGPLLMFERDGAGSTFDPEPAVVGEMGISVAMTRDELLAFTTSLDPAINTVQFYQRSSLADSFELAPALGSIRLTNPEPAPDGTGLWGVVSDFETGRSRLAFSSFNEGTGNYEAPAPAGSVPPEGASDVSPALSGNCRELYLARIKTSAGGSEVLVARR